MEKYLKRGLLSCLVIFGLLITMCLNDPLYAAAKKVDHIEAVYDGDMEDLHVGDRIEKADFKVTVWYTDDDYDILGTRDFDLELTRSDDLTMQYVEDVARITYGNYWDRVELTAGGGSVGDNEESRILLSISATYDGDPLPVGGMAIRRDFTVRATYRVYYAGGTVGRLIEELEDGWILEAHTITSGDNDLTITYSEKGVRKSCSVVVKSTGTDGNWIKDGDTWRYRYDDSTYLTGDWLRSGGKYYYMDEYGYMMNRVKTNIDGNTYYFDDTGVMQTGWVYLGRNWYFFGNDGKMQKGWVHTGGNWYYMDNEGIMLTNWVSLNGKWYFLDTDGRMLTGWIHRSYTWFYLNESGEMQTGWVYTGGKWYFMDHGGAMLTNTWVGNNYVDGSGAWVSSR